MNDDHDSIFAPQTPRRGAFPDCPIIKVRDCAVHFPIYSGVFSKQTGIVKAVDGISFSIQKGEVFALVGESGCGKTTTAQGILGLVPITSGKIELGIGEWSQSPATWHSLSTLEKQNVRKHMQVIFQDPYSSLNPRMTVRSILSEPLIIHGLKNKSDINIRVAELLAQTGLSTDFLDRFPHEFSGGQRQRIGIARALATHPECIIADEPVSALDVSIQAQIINLLQDLQEQFQLTMLFISHSLAVVRHLATRVAIMYRGTIVELGSEQQIFDNPLHPYTHLLLECVPEIGKGRRTHEGIQKESITGEEGAGCPFYPRCKKRKAECLGESPVLTEREHGHAVACLDSLSG